MTDDNIPDPREAEAAEWSPQQWQQWFRDEVMGTSDWRVLERQWDDAEQEFPIEHSYSSFTGKDSFYDPREGFSYDRLTGEVDPDLLSGVRALARVMDKDRDVYAALWRESWEHAFARLSEERRLDFFRGWNRVVAHDAEAAVNDVAQGALREAATDASMAGSVSDSVAETLGFSNIDDPTLDPRSDWNRSQYWVNITLPNGNVATVPTGAGPSKPGVGDFVVGDIDGEDFEPPEITITEPNPDAVAPPPTPEPPPPPPEPQAPEPPPVPPASGASFAPFGIAPFTAGCFATIIGGLIALAVVAVLALNLLGGGDDIAVPSDTDGPAAAGAATAEATTDLGESRGGGPVARGVQLEVFEINGEHFYRYIFDELRSPELPATDPNRYSCEADYAVHLMAAHTVARSFQNPHVAVPDPAPAGCGYGKTVTFTTNGRVVNPTNSVLDPEFPRLNFASRVIGEWCFYTLQDLKTAGSSNTAVENLCSRNPRQTD